MIEFLSQLYSIKNLHNSASVNLLIFSIFLIINYFDTGTLIIDKRLSFQTYATYSNFEDSEVQSNSNLYCPFPIP